MMFGKITSYPPATSRSTRCYHTVEFFSIFEHTTSTRSRVAVATFGVVTLWILVLCPPHYYEISPITTASTKAKSSANEILDSRNSCGALSNDRENIDHGTQTNVTALEWIMESPLGCEFLFFGGREQVLEKLRNKHILFIGDSVLRYQYRALLYSLRFGHTNIKGPGNDTHPSEVYAHSFHSFNRFYQQAQFDLTEEYFQCDCFRRDDNGDMFENMYYFEHKYNFNLTFFFHANRISGGHRPLRWKPEFNKSVLDEYVSQGSNATAPIVAFNFFHAVSIPDLVKMFLEDVGPVDELVVSLGDHWAVPGVGRNDSSSQWTWDEYARPLEQLVGASNTPTYALSVRKRLRAPLTSLALEDDWKIFNRTAIIEPLVEMFRKQEWPINMLYADGIHFWGWVYDRLNAELLQVLLPQYS